MPALDSYAQSGLSLVLRYLLSDVSALLPAELGEQELFNESDDAAYVGSLILSQLACRAKLRIVGIRSSIAF